jgi:hypothetical protein
MQHKATVYIHWVPDTYSGKAGGHFSYDAHNWEPRDGYPGLDGYYLVGTTEINCEILEIDARQRLVEKLKTDKANLITKATRDAERLEEQIQQLLALPSA